MGCGVSLLCSLLLPSGLLLGDSRMEIALLCFLGTFTPPGRLRQRGAGVGDVEGRVGTPGIMQVSKDGLSQSRSRVEIRRGCFAFSTGGTAVVPAEQTRASGPWIPHQREDIVCGVPALRL